MDIVKLVNRIKEPLEFMYDSNLYILKGGESRLLPKHIAIHAIKSAPIRIDAATGMIMDSMFGISIYTSDGSAGKDLYPTTPIDIDPEEVRTANKLDAQIVPGDTRLKKKTINLKPHNENFAENNNQ